MNITVCDECKRNITSEETCVNLSARLQKGGSNLTYEDYIKMDLCAGCAKDKFGKKVKQ